VRDHIDGLFQNWEFLAPRKQLVSQICSPPDNQYIRELAARPTPPLARLDAKSARQSTKIAETEVVHLTRSDLAVD
jgi:hypothetical protein